MSNIAKSQIKKEMNVECIGWVRTNYAAQQPKYLPKLEKLYTKVQDGGLE